MSSNFNDSSRNFCRSSLSHPPWYMPVGGDSVEHFLSAIIFHICRVRSPRGITLEEDDGDIGHIRILFVHASVNVFLAFDNSGSVAELGGLK